MPSPPTIVGRYAIHEAFASGGTATVHYGRMQGLGGFSRTVAIKRLHPTFAGDASFVAMLLDEARLASRVVHPHVVPVLDVVASDNEILLVMEYVAGTSLASLLGALHRDDARVPIRVASAIMSGVLQGLHAAHEAVDDRGEPLAIVHRDMSPQNVLVGADGQARVVDFGIAKARGRSQHTTEGTLKGKLRYMAPEQLEHEVVDRRVDVYAAGVVLWELMTGKRLFAAGAEAVVMREIMNKPIDAPSASASFDDRERELATALDDVVLRALARDPEARFPNALAMARAIEARVTPATAVDVAAWVESIAGDELRVRAEAVAAIERELARDPVSDLAGADEATRVPAGNTGRTEGPPPAARPLRGKRSALVLGLMALAAAGLAMYFAGRSPTSRELGPITTPVAAPTNTVTSPNPAESSPVDPVAAPLPPSATSAAAPPPSIAKQHRGRARGTPVGTAPTRKVDCTTPYTWDENGAKHFRPECL